IFNYVDGSFVENKTRLYGSAEGRNLGSSVAFPQTTPGDVGDENPVLPQAEYMLVGAPGAVAREPACAFVFAHHPPSDVKTGTTFAESAQLVNSSRQEGDRFAAAVAASGFQNGSWSFLGVAAAASAGVEGGGYLYAHGEPAPTWMDAPVLVENPALRWG